MNYFFLVFANIFMWVTAMLLAPILPLFAVGKNHLPTWLAWFDTPDNSLDGDAGWLPTHPNSTYWNRVCWLWRNPAYGFDISVLGITVATMPTVMSGDKYVSDGPVSMIDRVTGEAINRTTGQSGSVHLTMGDYWEWYHVSQWGKSNKCVRIRLGWKLLGYVLLPDLSPLGSRTQFVFSPKPYSSFTI